MNRFNQSANRAVRDFIVETGTNLTTLEIYEFKQILQQVHTTTFKGLPKESIGFMTPMEARVQFLDGYGITPEEYNSYRSKGLFPELFRIRRNERIVRPYGDDNHHDLDIHDGARILALEKTCQETIA